MEKGDEVEGRRKKVKRKGSQSRETLDVGGILMFQKGRERKKVMLSQDDSVGSRKRQRPPPKDNRIEWRVDTSVGCCVFFWGFFFCGFLLEFSQLVAAVCVGMGWVVVCLYS